MDNIFKIAKQLTIIDNKHESLYRSFAVLQLVKQLLDKNVPHEVILDLIRQIEKEQ